MRRTDAMTTSEKEDLTRQGSCSHPEGERVKASTWRWDRMPLICGVIAGPLFVTAFLIQGALRPDYNPLRHSISTLELGSAFGWIQSLNFIVASLLTLAFAVGARRVLRLQMRSIWGPLLIGLWAVGLMGAGIFVTDPDIGYPPRTPYPIQASMHGILHNLSAGLQFPAGVLACLVFARWFAVRRERGWAFSSAVSGVVLLISVVLASYAFPRPFPQTEGLSSLGGLFQRIAAVCGWGWLTALAIHLLMKGSASRAR